MENLKNNRIFPSPNRFIEGDLITRPDWTVVARNTKGVIPLDKNENLDSELQSFISEILKSISVHTATEYPECAPYYKKLSDHLNLDPENLLFAPGSDGAIRAVFETFVSPTQKVLQTNPSFAMYPLYTQMLGAESVLIDYKGSKNGPKLDVTEICKKIKMSQPSLLCLPNPDSPTGTIFSYSELEEIVETCYQTEAMVLIDEAYHPFSDITALPLISKYKNLVVARTFAKGWGIAGLRLGFAAAHRETVYQLHKVRPMYEVNGLALSVMERLIDNFNQIEAAVTRTLTGKTFFLKKMEGLGFKTLTCSGNFVHVDFGKSRELVHKKLAGKVLYKISFNAPCLSGYSRFTVGPENIMSDVINIIEEA